MLTKDGYRFHARKLRGDCCEKCGTKEGLNAHHMDGDITNNSQSNIQTLCASCHTTIHWEEGKRPHRRHAPYCVVCGKPSTRGLCETHRTRQKRHGSPYLVKRKIGSGWQLVDERTGMPVSGPEYHALPPV